MLLVSHGGPTSYVFCALTGSSKAPPTGYCGLYGYTWIGDDEAAVEAEAVAAAAAAAGGESGSGEDGRSPPRRGGGAGGGGCGYWKALVVSDHEHLKEVDAPISGPNDMVEQDAAAHGM